MLLSEMFGVERDVEFGVEGYEKTLLFKISLNYNGTERLMSKYSDKDKWNVALPETIFTVISIAPSGIIHLPPLLTDEQREQLKALYTLGYFLLAKDKNGEVFAYSKSIFKWGVVWATGVNRHMACIDSENPITRLVSWSDPEPFDIGKALGVTE